MAYKKRIRAQTGGQVSEEKRRQIRGERVDAPGGAVPAAPRGLVDPAALALADIFELDPETLEFPLAGFVKDPQSKKNVAMEAFRKTYPGLVLPSEPGFVKGPVQFKRDAKTGKLTLIPREAKAKGGKVGKVMHEYKAGTLHSGSKKGPRVRSRDQAIAIAMSEARKAGEDIPRRRAAKGGITGLPGFKNIGGVAINTKTGLTPTGQTLEQYTAERVAATGGGGGTGGGGAAPTGVRAGTPITAAGSKGTFGAAGDVASRLTSFQPGGGPDVASLRGFDPLTGAARTTQNELLSTGAPTDVGPLTEAAKTRAGQEFDTATSGINERLASMGLLSSTSQTAAEARERAKLGERVGATGLEAGVQAAEAATGRRAGAVGAELGASGQRLGALGQAGQLSLGQSGQQLSGLEGAGGLFQGLTGIAEGGRQFDVGQASNTAQFQAGLQQQANLANQAMEASNAAAASAPGWTSLGGGTSGGGTSGTSGVGTASGGVSGGPYIPRYGGAEGGRVDAPDFFSNAAYGRLFTKPRAFDVPRLTAPTRQRSSSYSSRGPVRGGGGPAYGGSSLDEAFKREALRRLMNPTGGGRKFDPTYEKWKIALTPSGYGKDFDQMRREQALQFIGAGGQGGGGASVSDVGPSDLMRRASFGREMPRNIQSPEVRSLLSAGTFVPQRQRAAGGGVPQPKLPQELGIQELSPYDPRRRFYNVGGPVESFDRRRWMDEGGGVAPGEDTGEDKIPAMLRSEELVLTPELAAAVEEANPLEPNPELIMSLQDLAKQPLEFDEGMGEHMAAQGGAAPTRVQNIDEFLRRRFGLPPTGERGAQIPEFATTPLPIGGEEVEFGPTIPRVPEEFLQYDTPAGFERAPLGEFEVPEELLGTPSTAAPGRGSVSLERVGGGPLTQAGDAGMGTITPRAGGKGSFSAMTSTVPSAQPLSPEELTQQRLNEATRRRDLLSVALNTDVVGSPEKQARLMSALDNADRQVSTITSEVLAREQQRMQREETGVRRVMAEANLNQSIASTLRSKAQQQTAEAALARQMLEAAASDPVVTQILNGLEKLGGIKDARTAAMYEAVFGKLLESRGVQLKENGWFKQLFGAPEYEVQPAQAEAGASPQDDTTAMLGASQVPITPEMLQYYTQFAGVQ